MHSINVIIAVVAAVVVTIATAAAVVVTVATADLIISIINISSIIISIISIIVIIVVINWEIMAITADVNPIVNCGLLGNGDFLVDIHIANILATRGIRFISVLAHRRMV